MAITSTSGNSGNLNHSSAAIGPVVLSTTPSTANTIYIVYLTTYSTTLTIIETKKIIVGPSTEIIQLVTNGSKSAAHITIWHYVGMILS